MRLSSDTLVTSNKVSNDKHQTSKDSNHQLTLVPSLRIGSHFCFWARPRWSLFSVFAPWRDLWSVRNGNTSHKQKQQHNSYITATTSPRLECIRASLVCTEEASSCARRPPDQRLMKWLQLIGTFSLWSFHHLHVSHFGLSVFFKFVSTDPVFLSS